MESGNSALDLQDKEEGEILTSSTEGPSNTDLLASPIKSLKSSNSSNDSPLTRTKFTLNLNINNRMQSNNSNSTPPKPVDISKNTISTPNTDNLLDLNFPKFNVLGKHQAKKRLQAFSVLKTNSLLKLPTKKTLNKSNSYSHITEDVYNDEGEKVDEKTVLVCKPPKKVTNPEEKAKAVIEEIEEIKKIETAYRVALEEQILNFRKKEKERRKEKLKDRSYRSQAISKELSERSSSEKRIKKAPSSWKEFVENGFDFTLNHEFRNKERDQAVTDFRKHLLFEPCSLPLNTLTVKSTTGLDKIVPAGCIRFTKCHPSVPFNINPNLLHGKYFSRSEIFDYIPKAQKNILMKIVTNTTVTSSITAKETKIRKWYPKISLTAVDPAECELLEPSMGLSYLKSYSDEEEEEEHIKQEEDFNKLQKSMHCLQEKIDRKTKTSKKEGKNEEEEGKRVKLKKKKRKEISTDEEETTSDSNEEEEKSDKHDRNQSIQLKDKLKSRNKTKQLKKIKKYSKKEKKKKKKKKNESIETMDPGKEQKSNSKVKDHEKKRESKEEKTNKNEKAKDKRPEEIKSNEDGRRKRSDERRRRTISNEARSKSRDRHFREEKGRRKNGSSSMKNRTPEKMKPSREEERKKREKSRSYEYVMEKEQEENYSRQHDGKSKVKSIAATEFGTPDTNDYYSNWESDNDITLPAKRDQSAVENEFMDNTWESDARNEPSFSVSSSSPPKSRYSDKKAKIDDFSISPRRKSQKSRQSLTPPSDPYFSSITYPLGLKEEVKLFDDSFRDHRSRCSPDNSPKRSRIQRSSQRDYRSPACDDFRLEDHIFQKSPQRRSSFKRYSDYSPSIVKRHRLLPPSSSEVNLFNRSTSIERRSDFELADERYRRSLSLEKRGHFSRSVSIEKHRVSSVDEKFRITSSDLSSSATNYVSSSSVYDAVSSFGDSLEMPLNIRHRRRESLEAAWQKEDSFTRSSGRRGPNYKESSYQIYSEDSWERDDYRKIDLEMEERTLEEERLRLVEERRKIAMERRKLEEMEMERRKVEEMEMRKVEEMAMERRKAEDMEIDRRRTEEKIEFERRRLENRRRRVENDPLLSPEGESGKYRKSRINQERKQTYMTYSKAKTKQNRSTTENLTTQKRKPNESENKELSGRVTTEKPLSDISDTSRESSIAKSKPDVLENEYEKFMQAVAKTSESSKAIEEKLENKSPKVSEKAKRKKKFSTSSSSSSSSSSNASSTDSSSSESSESSSSDSESTKSSSKKIKNSKTNKISYVDKIKIKTEPPDDNDKLITTTKTSSVNISNDTGNVVPIQIKSEKVIVSKSTPSEKSIPLKSISPEKTIISKPISPTTKSVISKPISTEKTTVSKPISTEKITSSKSIPPQEPIASKPILPVKPIVSNESSFTSDLKLLDIPLPGCSLATPVAEIPLPAPPVPVPSPVVAPIQLVTSTITPPLDILASVISSVVNLDVEKPTSNSCSVASPSKKVNLIPIKLLSAETRKQANENPSTVPVGTIDVKDIIIATSSANVSSTTVNLQGPKETEHEVKTIAVNSPQQQIRFTGMSIPSKKLLLGSSVLLCNDEDEFTITEDSNKINEDTNKTKEGATLSEKQDERFDSVEKSGNDDNKSREEPTTKTKEDKASSSTKRHQETPKSQTSSSYEKKPSKDYSRKRELSLDRSKRRRSPSLSFKDRRRESPRRRGGASPIRRRSPHRRDSSRRRSSISPRRRDAKSPRRDYSPRRRDSSPRRRREYSPRRRGYSPRRRDSPPRRRKSLTPLKDKNESIQEALQRIAGIGQHSTRIRQPSPVTSPIDGSRKSVAADSTISDEQLMLQNADRMVESPGYYARQFQNSCAPPHSGSPASPRRPSLDERIVKELGVPRENLNMPRKDVTVGYEQNYNYNMDIYEQYPENYQLHYHQDQQSYSMGYGQSTHVQTPINKVVQVGNVLQVVPTDDLSKTQPPLPIPPSNKVESDRTQKILQVGNMLQIVPTAVPVPVPPAVVMPVVQGGDVFEKISPSPVQLLPERAEIMNEQEKRKQEREKKREEKKMKRLEKERKKQIKIKQKTEDMIKQALLQETDDVENSEKSGTVTQQWPPLVVVPSISKPIGRGILLSSRLDENSEREELKLEKRKSVSFADGVLPGEGTSPSGGEELCSPPPPTKKLPKEKRFKKGKLPKKMKKRKIKVKVIRQQDVDDEDEDNLPPPPPPPGSPPPHVFPARIKTHINNVQPGLVPNLLNPQVLSSVSSYNPYHRHPLPVIMPPPPGSHGPHGGQPHGAPPHLDPHIHLGPGGPHVLPPPGPVLHGPPHSHGPRPSPF